MAFNTMNLFLIKKDTKLLDMVASIDTSKLNEIQTKLRLERQYEHLNFKFEALIKLVSSLKLNKLQEVVSFIAFANNFQKDVLGYGVEGDELIKTITTFIEVVELKKIEADDRLLEFGSKMKLIEIGGVYEDIQKYLS